MPPQTNPSQSSPDRTPPTNKQTTSPKPHPNPKPPDPKIRENNRENETEAQKQARHQARYERRREREMGLDDLVDHETGFDTDDEKRRRGVRLGGMKGGKGEKEEKRGILRKSRQSIGRGIVALGQRVAGDGVGNRVGNGNRNGAGVVGKGILYSRNDEKSGEKEGRVKGDGDNEQNRRRRRRRRSTVGEGTDGEERDRVAGEKQVRFDCQESALRVSEPLNDEKEKEAQNSTPRLGNPLAKPVPSPSPVKELKDTNPKGLAKEVEGCSLLEAKKAHIAKRAREERERAQQEANNQALQADRVKKGKEDFDRAAKEKLALGRGKEKELEKEKQQKNNCHQESSHKAEEEHLAHPRQLELETHHQVTAHRIKRQKEEQAHQAHQKAALHKAETIRLEKIKREKEQEVEGEISRKKEEERQRRIEAQRHLEIQRRALELEKVRREEEREKEREQARQRAEIERLALEKQRAKAQAQAIKADVEKAARHKADEEKQQQERLRRQAEEAKVDASRIRANLPANHAPAAMKAAALLAQKQVQKQNAPSNKKPAPLSPLIPIQPQNKVAQHIAHLNHRPPLQPPLQLQLPLKLPPKLTHKNLNPTPLSPPEAKLKRCIGNMERTILEGYVPMDAEEIRAKEIETGEIREKRCIGNMERTILEGYVPMSEEEIRMGNRGRY